MKIATAACHVNASGFIRLILMTAVSDVSPTGFPAGFFPAGRDNPPLISRLRFFPCNLPRVSCASGGNDRRVENWKSDAAETSRAKSRFSIATRDSPMNNILLREDASRPSDRRWYLARQRTS